MHGETVVFDDPIKCSALDVQFPTIQLFHAKCFNFNVYSKHVIWINPIQNKEEIRTNSKSATKLGTGLNSSYLPQRGLEMNRHIHLTSASSGGGGEGCRNGDGGCGRWRVGAAGAGWMALAQARVPWRRTEEGYMGIDLDRELDMPLEVGTYSCPYEYTISNTGGYLREIG